MTHRITSFLLLISIAYFFWSCNPKLTHINEVESNILNEVEVTPIPLLGEISKKTSEISGLCWYGDKLILLPQYPNSFNSVMGRIFFIEKERLSNFISGNDTSAILPDYFSIDISQFDDLFSQGSGFEAMTINNDTAYFSIESMNNGQTESILIKGKINFIDKMITLDKSSMVKDSSKLFMKNISDESILLYNNKIIPIYEVFGINRNNNPQVSLFDNNLNFLAKIKFPNIEYRITDVTEIDENRKFWAINYFFPGDFYKLNPTNDFLVQKYGNGLTHSKNKAVERLVEFQIEEDQVIIVNRAPIYLKLTSKESRNWEGLARYGNEGFFIVTDTYPETIFAYIKVPNL